MRRRGERRCHDRPVIGHAAPQGRLDLRPDGARPVGGGGAGRAAGPGVVAPGGASPPGPCVARGRRPAHPGAAAQAPPPPTPPARCGRGGGAPPAAGRTGWPGPARNLGPPRPPCGSGGPPAGPRRRSHARPTPASAGYPWGGCTTTAWQGRGPRAAPERPAGLGHSPGGPHNAGCSRGRKAFRPRPASRDGGVERVGAKGRPSAGHCRPAMCQARRARQRQSSRCPVLTSPTPERGRGAEVFDKVSHRKYRIQLTGLLPRFLGGVCLGPLTACKADAMPKPAVGHVSYQPRGRLSTRLQQGPAPARTGRRAHTRLWAAAPPPAHTLAARPCPWLGGGPQRVWTRHTPGTAAVRA